MNTLIAYVLCINTVKDISTCVLRFGIIINECKNFAKINKKNENLGLTGFNGLSRDKKETTAADTSKKW